MDSEPEYVIGAGMPFYKLVSAHCPPNFWETSRQRQKALVDWIGSIFGLVDNSCLELRLFRLLRIDSRTFDLKISLEIRMPDL